MDRFKGYINPPKVEVKDAAMPGKDVYMLI